MTPVKPALDQLLDHLLTQLPSPNPEERQVALLLYRLLAEGEPVAPWQVAGRLHLPVSRVEGLLNQWPGVYREDDGRVAGFWGLSVRTSPHTLEIGGRTLYTWCAWDGLFLPVVLNQEARFESRCPVSAQTVTLTVTPTGIRHAEPRPVAMSFITPEAARVRENILLYFCRFLHFFLDREEAEEWVEIHDGTFLLHLDEAFELGRRKVVAQFGEALLDSSS